MKQIVFILLTAVLLYACEKKHFYNKYQSVNIKAWKSSDTATFPIAIENAAHAYKYALSVRYAKDYEFSNVWLKVTVKGNTLDTSFRYEIPLFMKDGKPYGKCSGSLCTQTVPLKTNLPIAQKGNYTISIVQLMRKDPLDGISDVGIIMDQQ